MCVRACALPHSPTLPCSFSTLGSTKPSLCPVLISQAFDESHWSTEKEAERAVVFILRAHPPFGSVPNPYCLCGQLMKGHRLWLYMGNQSLPPSLHPPPAMLTTTALGLVSSFPVTPISFLFFFFPVKLAEQKIGSTAGNGGHPARQKKQNGVFIGNDIYSLTS